MEKHKKKTIKERVSEINRLIDTNTQRETEIKRQTERQR